MMYPLFQPIAQLFTHEPPREPMLNESDRFKQQHLENDAEHTIESGTDVSVTL
jgi:hypothetical protein